MKEIFKDIPLFGGRYKISNTGSVISIVRNKAKKISIQTDSLGYESVKLYSNGHAKRHKIHSLVASVFVPNTDNKNEVNHIDGVKNNNTYSNLEWCTRSENMIHACKMGLAKRKGSNNGRSKLTELDVMEIKFHLSIGECRKRLSKTFNISKSIIDKISIGKVWCHVEIHKQQYL